MDVHSDMKSMDSVRRKNIVFFDGYCNLCNASIDFMAKRNPHGLLYFASLQSNLAAELLPDLTNQKYDPKSIIFWCDEKRYEKSTAILKICSNMSFPYPWFKILWLIPRPLRDWVYRRVANNRYQWFGKRASCRIPTDAEQEMFLS